MDKLIGKKLDGLYEIVELIGSGGMANVYKAINLRNDTTVSVKVLREEFMNDEDLVRRFKNESKAISILNHQNIVKVYDVSVTDKLQYIVMEYIDGITLRDYLNQRGGTLTWRETVHFIGQILNALQHAHENGVVHRDVKPQNIMLLPSGELKMMDFGIARIARAENQLVSGKAMGSVHYISPEQAKGDETDAKSDIYSAGVMMYEMLSGRLPFSKGSVVEVAIMQISDKPEPLANLVTETPHALIEITERAMAKNPEERYQSVAEMLVAIQEFKNDPNISFDYKYMADHAPVRVIDKVMNKNKNTKKPKQTKKQVKKRKNYFVPILLGITIAFAIGCGLLCKMILENSNNPLFSNKADLELGDFNGLTVEEIEKSAQSNQIKLVIEEEYNSNVQEGLVYKQSPRAGRTIKEGQIVTLTVSLGTKYITLSNYENMTQDDAKQSLLDQGVYVQVLKNVEPSVATGAVIKTEPEAGTVVEAGSTVYLYVSMAKVETKTTVPDLLGVTKEDGIRLLTQKRISVGSQIEEYSVFPVGTIIAQSVPAGTSVQINSRVGITVSIGPEPTPTPAPYVPPVVTKPTATPTPDTTEPDTETTPAPVDPPTTETTPEPVTPPTTETTPEPVTPPTTENTPTPVDPPTGGGDGGDGT